MKCPVCNCDCPYEDLIESLELFCEDCSVYELLKDLKKAEKYQ